MRKLFVCFLILSVLLSVVGCSASASPDSFVYFGGDAMGEMAAPATNGSTKSPMEDESNSDFQSQTDISAGLLTAGEWNDAENLDFWTKLLNNNDWYQLMEDWNLYSNRVVRAFVHDAAGNPCYYVPVSLLSEDGTVLYEAVTGIDGYANLLYNLQNEDASAAFVSVNGAQTPVTDGFADITAENAGLSVTMLDLMLMIDTTGSMGDELQYLQAELKDVVNRVAAAGEALSIHVSVNFYRDKEDTYVIRDFEFTSDVRDAVSNLKKQNAEGGGDYPEAVHLALDNIVYDHQWRNGAVKLCFFVLDAPPHTEAEIAGICDQMRQAVTDAAKAGIRIIPVASSGVDTNTEFLLRSWALMTGGTYTFLTDHSGIGNGHLEPTIGDYEVEALNECLIRIISEYCGLEYTAPNKNSQ